MQYSPAMGNLLMMFEGKGHSLNLTPEIWRSWLRSCFLLSGGLSFAGNGFFGSGHIHVHGDGKELSY